MRINDSAVFTNGNVAFKPEDGKFFVRSTPTPNVKWEYVLKPKVVIKCSKKHRLIDKPSLETLHEAPSSPHICIDEYVSGQLIKTKEGYWLKCRHESFNPNPQVDCYMWVSNNDIIYHYDYNKGTLKDPFTINDL